MSAARLTTIDCQYTGPGIAAAYLRVQGEEAAFIENNTAHALPELLGALEAAGLSPEQVRWIIVTHVHLDHAGGTSALAAACPGATVLAHPRAARHLIDPAKLIRGAQAVYGEARFEELYGRIEPIDAARVRPLDDGATVPLGDATLRFIHTRGHANHHFVVHDPARESVFTGDAFGIVYPRLQRARPFAFPSTTPTDFDAAAAHASVDTILGLGVRRAALTHFGEIEGLDVVAEQLHRWLEVAGALVEEGARLPPAEADSMVQAVLRVEMERAAGEAGLALDEEDRAMLELDISLNAQGIVHAATKRQA